jgi:hypothetical protein
MKSETDVLHDGIKYEMLLFYYMTEELSTARYCDLCGVDVELNANLKRFGKLFCSEDHMNQYVKARQKRLGLGEEGAEEVERKEEPRRRSSCC